jgi:hypothetical protein
LRDEIVARKRADMARLRFDACLILAATAACGGTSSGPATSSQTSVTGTVNGRSFAAKDAIVTSATGAGFSFGGPASFIEITDFAGACVEETARLQPSTGQRLVLGFASYDSTGKPLPPGQPGTFPVHQNGPGTPGTNIAQLYYDGGCQKAQAHAGLSGTVTVTAVGTDGTLDGTFNVVLTCDGFSTCSGPDANLIGSFHGAACAGLNVNATPACG